MDSDRLIGRVHVNDIRLFLMYVAQRTQHILFEKDRLIFEMGRMQILLYAGACLAAVLDEIGFQSTPAQSFYADRTASGAQIRTIHVKRDLCDDCGACAAQCPAEAISAG